MRKLKLKIVTVFAALAIVFGGTIPPVLAFAEETQENTSVFVEETTDNSSFEEVVEEEETSEKTAENEPILESGKNTFENFLEWAEQEADRYGYGDEYRLAFEDIKNAATIKQVTISTVVNALLWLAGIVYIVYKKIVDKKKLQGLSDIVNQSAAQAKKLNELVDATNDNSKAEEEIKKETAELKAEMKKTSEALMGFINGFMHFAESVKMKETKKDEIRRDCTNALKKIDGEVVSNENNENNKE